MSLLHRMRIGELEGTNTKTRRKFDNATAFRLLSAHREAVSQQKAIREDEDEDAILASIKTKLDAMRAREKAVRLLIGQTNSSSIKSSRIDWNEMPAEKDADDAN
jgi:hypothetical protein